MNELHLQDKFLVPFMRDELGYREVHANTVNYSLIIESDLEEFLSTSELNKKEYEKLLKKCGGDKQALLDEVMAEILKRVWASRNMAIFLNQNKSLTVRGVKLFLFHPSGSITRGDKDFQENIFSVVQELPYRYPNQGKKLFAIRPDLCFFVNGIFLGYSELKSNYTNQSARKNGRTKVLKDYYDAVRSYHDAHDKDEMLSDMEKGMIKRDALKLFEKAIHITTTDIRETYVLRTISNFFDDIMASCREGKREMQVFHEKALEQFKAYPLLKPDAEKKEKLKEVFTAHYSKENLENEILYYNFIERDTYFIGKEKQLKDEKGFLIAPRPKQKFGTDKVLAKIDEFLEHEQDENYYENLLEKQLAGVSEAKKQELLEKRKRYSNNKNVYSLLMQYAAGFGKSNIIGWCSLQLKDLIRPNAKGDPEYVYDKIMIVVDRLQLRGQIDSKMMNMNIDNKMFVEANNKKTFQDALKSDKRIVIVNLQKFGSVKEMLDAETIEKLGQLRTVFLIDEIHRSNSGNQHEEMVSIFDELQSPFDQHSEQLDGGKKKNLIIGFTATPSDHTLARFGEFAGYAENEKLWKPFDSYTMKEAIDDDFILNPLRNIIPVAAKMIFDLPGNKMEGFDETQFKDVPKKDIYTEPDRIADYSKYVADLLVKDVYRQIRGTGKAMLACYSIPSAIKYRQEVQKAFDKLVEQPKYAKYKKAPILIVYSDNQEYEKASGYNQGLNEAQVLQKFAKEKNGLIIVVDKLQTGFDEKRLHTLFLDKEITGISAIQTISRVNRTARYKNDCKIVDFSYENVNVQNIKDAFEHFSDVVVSDFDPFSDLRVLEIDYRELHKSDVYAKFWKPFKEFYANPYLRNDPEHFLDWEDSLEKFINLHEKRCADAKAKASQYFTILNRIEFVISLEDKYKDEGWLLFWRKYNTIYNLVYKTHEVRDPIEVYFDNQIGIIEVETEEAKEKKKRETKLAEDETPFNKQYEFDVLAVIEKRNQSQEQIAELIKSYAEKIQFMFKWITEMEDGKRLIAQINSLEAEDEIQSSFRKLYRAFKIKNRKEIGDRFFKDMEDLVDKLCQDFEEEVKK